MKFLTCFRGDHIPVRDPSSAARMVTIAFALMLPVACQESHRLLGDGCILVEGLDDDVHGHWRFAHGPHIVVSYMCHGGVTNLRFAGEEGFRRRGHADNGHAPGSVSTGFRFGGKARSFDRDQGTAAVENAASCAYSGFKLVRKIAAKRIRHAHVGNDPPAEAGAGASMRVVVDLVWDHNVTRRKLLL